MKDVLTKEELSAFFNACENYMYKTIFMLIYGSGLRISEAVSLKVEDIDSKKMRIGVIIDIWTHLMRGCIIMYTNLKGVCQKWQKEKYTMKILKR